MQKEGTPQLESELSADERLKEADAIVEDLHCVDLAEFSHRERDFVEGMESAEYCSPAQLSWLRAIKAKLWEE